MAQSRCRLVGQALQMPHRYSLCQLVLCLVHTLVDILVDKVVQTAPHVIPIQIQVCLDTTNAMYLVIGSLAQHDNAADGDADIPVARRLAAPGRAIDHSASHYRIVVVDQLCPLEMLYPQPGVLFPVPLEPRNM